MRPRFWRKPLKNKDSEFGFRSAGFGIWSARLGFRSEGFGNRSGGFGNRSSRRPCAASPLLDRPLAREALNKSPRRFEPLTRRYAFAKFESFAADAEREGWRRLAK